MYTCGKQELKIEHDILLRRRRWNRIQQIRGKIFVMKLTSKIFMNYAERSTSKFVRNEAGFRCEIKSWRHDNWIQGLHCINEPARAANRVSSGFGMEFYIEKDTYIFLERSNFGNMR